MPPAVAAALSEELALLSDGARLALDGAAVAGDPFEPELMAAAAASARRMPSPALDELLRRDLVRHTDVPRRFRFRHPLVRRAIYDASPGGWRLGAHQRSAEALAERGVPAAARAHHVERSARHGDSAAVAILREAGSAAAQRAPESAARWFRAALRMLGDTASAEERVELLTALAGAQAATGHFIEARSALLEAMALLPEDATAARTQLSAGCAGLEQLLGRHDEAHGRLVNALESLDDPVSPEAVALMITLAMDAFYRQASTDSRSWGARALAVARPLGDEPLIAAASAALALACAFEGALADAELHRAAAAELVDAMPDEKLAIRLDAIAYLTGAELYMDHFQESTSHGLRGLALARATGQGFLVPMLTQATASALGVQGHLLEASVLLDGAIEASRLAGNDQTLAWDLMNRAFIDAHRGEMDAAISAAEESLDLTNALGSGFVSTHAGVMLAIARMENGEPAKAVELFVTAGGGEDMPLAAGRLAGEVSRSTDARLVTGRSRRRSGTFRRRRRRGRRRDGSRHGRRMGAARRSRGRTRGGRAGRGRRSGARLGRGLRRRGSGGRSSGFADAGRPGACARGRSGARGRRAATRNRHTRGVRRAALPARGGARAAQARARRPRRSRPGKLDEIGIASLSERELELARLVVDRRTNPEIAAALFLSQKTVESHLRNIFRKLDVASRVELARIVERADRSAGDDHELEAQQGYGGTCCGRTNCPVDLGLPSS